MLLLTVSVVVAGWYGGLGPALFATGLSVVTGWYFLVPERGSFVLNPTVEIFRLTLFAGVGITMSLLSGRMHSSVALSRRSEELFRRTIRDAPFPIMLHREDGQVLMLSHAWTGLSGYTRSEIPTIDDWAKRAYGERQHEMRERIRQLYSIEQPFDGGEQSVRTASEESRTWVFRSSPMGRDESGLRVVLSVAHDVTERVAAERELASSHSKLQATIDSITDGLLVLDRQWRCTYISETGARMLGMRSADLMGGSLWELFPDAVQRKFYIEFHNAVETASPVHFEEFYPEPLNRWLECHCYPSAEGLSVYFRDITDRKRVEEALRTRTAELDSLLENAPIGFAFFDREHRYVRMNDRLAEMNGLPVEAHIGRTVGELLPVNARSVDPVIDRVFSTAQPVRVEIAGETPKEPGQPRYWLTGFYPVLGEDGTAATVGAFVLETTERRKAEQALRESKERLKLALDSARMGTFDIAVETNMVVWDERSSELFGFPTGAVVNLELVMPRLHDEDRDRIRQAITAAYNPAGDGRYEVEYRVVSRDNSVRWVVSTGRVYFKGAGAEARAVRLIGVNLDVTERKLAEIALLEGEERFRIAAAAAQLGLFEWDDVSGQAFWHNARMYEIFKRAPEAGPIDRTVFLSECLHADDAVPFAEALEHSRNTGGPLRVAVRISCTRDGERWLKVEGAFRPVENGQRRLLAIAQDVTEARRMERTLRENEAFLAAVFEGLPIGVGTTDAQGRTLSMNKVGLRLHGFASVKEMLTGLEHYRQEFELRYPNGPVMPEQEWPLARANRGDYVSDYEVVLRRLRTGEERIIAYTAVPVRGGGGGEQINVFLMQDVTERRGAEQRLRASEAQYRALFDSIDEGFCVIEMRFDEQNRPVDYLFLEANPAFERHTGIINGVGRMIREMVPDLDRSWFEIYGRVALTGEAVRFENDAPAMHRTFDVYAFRVGAPQQRRVALLFNDISLRKQNEAAVDAARREAESQRRLLDAVLDSLPVGVIIADASGKLVRWNRANETLWGLDSVDPSSTANIDEYGRWVARWPDTGRLLEPHEWVIARALLNREVSQGELVEIQRFDGTGRRFTMNMGAPVIDEAGNVIAAVAAQTDVTERVNMERALRESEDKFRTISDNVPQLAWMADEKGRNLWYNRRWFEYTGITTDRLLASPKYQDARHSDVVHPEDRAKVDERWRHSLRSGEPYEMEFRLRRHDGLFRWFLGRALAIRDGNGRIVRWFGTDTDIHEQKSTESALRRSNEDLQQFAYVASHDLQEPLRTVVAFSQLLGRRYSRELDNEAHEYLGYLADAALRMSDLVRDLLVYSHATKDGDRIVEPVPLQTVLEGVLHSLHSQIEETGAVVHHEPLPVVIGDRLQLGQVLQNLISNALKYRRNGTTPEVRIRAVRQASEWVISVSDNGQGFGQEYADRIFGIFKRLHGKDIPGTGIGLAICKTVVERHGGEIWAESTRGKGSTFSFTLPVSDGDGDG
jgi:PAS domain S-box-containing protein